MYEIKQINAVKFTILKVALPYFWICVFKMFYHKNNGQVTSYTISRTARVNLRNLSFSIVAAIAYFS